MSECREITTPPRTKETLLKHGFSFKKSLEQNFLTESNILRKIVETAQIDEYTDMIEIGPGIGALTEQLAKHTKQVVTFEIDDHLIPVLAGAMQPCGNMTIVHQDILKIDLSTAVREISHEELPLKVIASLPYYIATPVVMHFLESDLIVDELVVMMQKEVADHISVKPGTKAYGLLSIAIQYYMEASLAFIVPKTVFVPQPNVDSAILKLTRRDIPATEVIGEETFFRLTKAVLQQRRKTLWNNLQYSCGRDDQTKTWLTKNLETAGIGPRHRRETLLSQRSAALSSAMSEDMQ